MILKDQVAIITGAARGIGKEIALTLGRNGADIIIADTNLAEAKRVADEMVISGQKAMAIKVDVSSKSQVRAMIETVIKEFSRIDILINNAGVCQPRTYEEITEEDWNKVIDINLKGTFFCSQAVFPIMKERKKGKIVNLSSLAAKNGGVTVGAHYAASKAGITSLTKSLAKESGRYNINVNAVAPGLIDTKMTKDFDHDLSRVPLGRLGKPADVADVVKFLVSDDARYLTGEIIDIDGGILMD